MVAAVEQAVVALAQPRAHAAARAVDRRQPQDDRADGVGRRPHRVLVRRYDVHGNACNGHPVYLLHGTERPPLHLGCTRPYRPRRAGDAGMGPASGRHPW